MFSKAFSALLKTAIKKTPNQKQKQKIYDAYVKKRFDYIDNLYDKAMNNAMIRNNPKAVAEFQKSKKKVLVDLKNNATNYAHKVAKEQKYLRDFGAGPMQIVQRAVTRVNEKGKFAAKDSGFKPQVKLVQTRGNMDAIFSVKKTARKEGGFKKGQMLTEENIRKVLKKQKRFQNKLVTKADIAAHKKKLVKTAKSQRSKEDVGNVLRTAKLYSKHSLPPELIFNAKLADKAPRDVVRKIAAETLKHYKNKPVKASSDRMKDLIKLSNKETAKDLKIIRNATTRKVTKSDVWDYKDKYMSSVETRVPKRLPKGDPRKRTTAQLAGKMKVGEKAVTDAFIRKVKNNLEKAASIGTIALPSVTIGMLLGRQSKEDKD